MLEKFVFQASKLENTNLIDFKNKPISRHNKGGSTGTRDFAGYVSNLSHYTNGSTQSNQNTKESPERPKSLKKNLLVHYY